VPKHAVWTAERARIEEHVLPGKRLGRHILHDSRSLAYRYQRSGAALRSVLHTRHIGILNQGDVGACTGNAETGALGCDPFFATIPGAASLLNEAEALALYSAAEVIDGDGPYPPNDDGSNGLSVCKAAKNAGLISGYVHCLSLADVLDALQERPVIIGSNWYDSFDSPSSSGMIAITPGSAVRGGHEYVMRGIDVDAQTVFSDNSWGDDWGDGGSFTYSWETLEQLLAEQGDGTVSVPITSPAPVPLPGPASVHPHAAALLELADDVEAALKKARAYLTEHGLL
jgi:hypothetical protein